MNRLWILCFVTLSVSVYAQTTDVITSLDDPNSIAFRGTEMYISEDGKVIKIDLTDPELAPVDVLTGFNSASHLLIDNDHLYVALYTGGKVVKLDLTEDNPTPVDVVTGVYGSNGLALKDGTLYIAESTENTISKVDLTSENPEVVDVVTGLEFPNALFLEGDDLYFIQVRDDKISKIDLSESQATPVDVITDLEDPSSGLIILGDELFFSQYGGDRVSKVNLTDVNPTITDVVTGLNGPTQLMQQEDELFIVVRFDNKIIKIDNKQVGVLSVTDHHESKLTLYPNPVVNSIAIKGLTKNETGALYSISGAKVMDFTVNENRTLDLQHMRPGIYQLVLDNGWSQKVIKR